MTAVRTANTVAVDLARVTLPAGDVHVACRPAELPVHDDTIAGYQATPFSEIVDGEVLLVPVTVGRGDVIVASRVPGRSYTLLAQTSCARDELADVLLDVTCGQCGSYNDDGEGYDGLCGNCADAAELEGRWS